MTITYNYEVLAVNPAARSMEILYTAEGREPVHMGTRMPFEGESLHAVIAEYAPIRHWQEQERPVATVLVGTAGTFTPPL